MKRYITLLIAAALSSLGLAQTGAAAGASVIYGAAQAAPSTPETFIVGDMNIDYATRIAGKKPGVADTYRFNVNVSNSSKFYGSIVQVPYISGTIGSYGQQNGFLRFDAKTDVLNPKNPTQALNVGTLTGDVPVSAQNVYDFDHGNLTARVFARGQAKGFDSSAKGVALGKPPAQAKSLLDRIKPAMTFTKQVGGQQQRIVVTKYDIMEFHNHVLPAGPVQIYAESTVNGKAVYGYDRNSWYFDHLIIAYWVTDANGSQHQQQDSISGDIRWVEDPNRKANGLGEYQFDLRVNEPPPPPDAVFAAPTDEAAFFSADAAAVGLSGTVKYKDRMTEDGESCVASVIAYDLHGNKLTKVQTMNLAKLILFSLTVPFNAE